jgi:hypothetical protein
MRDIVEPSKASRFRLSTEGQVGHVGNPPAIPSNGLQDLRDTGDLALERYLIKVAL